MIVSKEKSTLGSDHEKLEDSSVIKFENEGDFISGIFVNIEESKKYKDSFGLSFIDDNDNKPKIVFVNNIVYEKIQNAGTKILSGKTHIIVIFTGKVRNEQNTFSYNTYEIKIKN